jgi:uncharacterized protein (TIGR00369 family)
MKLLEAMKRVVRGESVDGFPLRIPPPVATLIGFEAIAVESGEAVFRLEARRDKHANPMGTVHGGILCDLVDGAMGMACASLLETGESFTTLELKINYLRPVWEGTLEARAKAVYQGKTQVYLESTITLLPDDKLIARASSTCLILRGDQARGR